MQLVSSDFQDQLIRGLAHRMNNILSVFHGYLGLMMDEQKLDPVLKEGLSKIRGSAHEATELISRINAVVRPSSCANRELNLPEFFRQLRPTVDTLQTPNIQLAIECPDDVPQIRANSSRLKIALLELLRNAFEAAASRVLIRVTASEKAHRAHLFPGNSEAAGGQFVRIGVFDDGKGIPQSEARRIFEPFFSTKKKHQSSGLGLAVALGCVQQFGGTLQHRGCKDGTCFEITLPAHGPQHLSAVA